MTSLPMQAGGAVAAAAGRTALWVISLYMRQPLRNTAVALLIGVSALAGSNALYKQAHHHPAPMFGSFASAPVVKKAAPVLPARKPGKLAQPVSDEPTGSVDEPARTIGIFAKDDIAAVQQKLQALGMFSGRIDGLFGPKTARAIKAFEASVGRPQKGELSTELVAMVREAGLPAQAPIVPRAPAVTPQAAPLEQPIVSARAELPPVAAEATVADDPLPAPAPLLPAAQKSVTAQVVQAPVNDDTAESAIQVATAEPEETTPAAPLAMVQPNTVLKRSVQTIAVRAKPAPAPAQDDAQQMPDQIASANDNSDASNDSDVVSSIQRGLNSLGFLHAKVSGVADEATAKAIRNFEVYFNYNVTGRVTRQLVDLLEQNGAVI